MASLTTNTQYSIISYPDNDPIPYYKTLPLYTPVQSVHKIQCYLVLVVESSEADSGTATKTVSAYSC